MFKYSVSVLILLIGINLSYAGKKEFHFRNANFGMTKQQVKDSEEGKPLEEENNRLTYIDDLLGFKVHVSFQFIDNKFFRGTYLFDQEYTNDNRYIEDFRKIKLALKDKYGRPYIGYGFTDAKWGKFSL